MVPLVVIMGSLQARLSAAFDAARTRVGEMLSEVSESVMGAAVVRAYGLDDTIDDRVTRAIGRRYDAEVMAHLRAATLLPMSSVFYALALAVVVAVGAIFGPELGAHLRHGDGVPVPRRRVPARVQDLPEIYSETQTAIAGWRKILAVLDLPVEIVEPDDGVRAADPRCARRSRERRDRSATARGRAVLRDICVDDRGRRARRDRRRDRQRQDHVREAAHAARRPGRGRDRGRRRRPARGRARVATGRDPHGAAGRVPVRRDRAGEREGRARGRDRPRRRHRVRGARARRLGALAAGRARHPRRRARRGAVRRRAAAGRARARADRRPRPADPRRGDERGGPGDRGAHHRGAAAAVGGPHDRHDRAPAVAPPSTPTTCSSSTPASSWNAARTRSSWRAGACTPRCTRAGSATPSSKTAPHERSARRPARDRRERDVSRGWRDLARRAARAGHGATRRLGRALHRGGLARRSVVRPRRGHGRRAAVPARAHAARRVRTAERAVRRPHARRRPPRPHHRLPPRGRTHRGRMGRPLAHDARPVPGWRAGVGRRDARRTARVHPARRRTVGARRRRGVGICLRAAGVGPLG